MSSTSSLPSSPPNLLLAADIRMSRQLLFTTILVIILSAQVLVTHGHTEGGREGFRLNLLSSSDHQPLGRDCFTDLMCNAGVVLA